MFLIYIVMYGYRGSSDVGADLDMDVLWSSFESLGHYRKQHSFFAWLYTLALNYARDWARKRSRREQTIDTFVRESDAHETIQPEHLVEAGQRAKGLIAALGMLAEDRREMVLLKYRHDCSIKEIAEIFEISDSAVKMRLKRALDELGQKLKN